MDGKVAFLHEVPIPDSSQQLVLGDDLAGVFDQELEDIECPGGQFEALVVLENGAFGCIQETVSELINLHWDLKFILLPIFVTRGW
jgi:hypothetical protein